MGTKQRIVVLSKKGLARRPYHRWLGGADRTLILFASVEDPAAHELTRVDSTVYSRVELFEDWRTNPILGEAVTAEHHRRSLSRIVALAESDLIRAATLREALGLPGQSPASARAFRHKFEMKTIAQAAGLAVPAFSKVSDTVQLSDFAKDTSGAVVLKPIDGSGSQGVRILRDRQSDTWKDAGEPAFDSGAVYIAEEFIDAPILSVDGVMAAGGVLAGWVSTYSRDCYSSVRMLRPHGLLQLRDDDPRAMRARTYLDRLLSALPCPQEATGFHCELFDDPHRGPMLCEIAARPGGGRLNDIGRISLGVDMDQWMVMGQAGLDPARSLCLPKRSNRLMGDALFPNPGRVLRRAPKSCPLPEVVDFSVRPTIGEFVPYSRKVSEYAIDVLYAADDRPALEETYERVTDWVAREVIWE